MCSQSFVRYTEVGADIQQYTFVSTMLLQGFLIKNMDVFFPTKREKITHTAGVKKSACHNFIIVFW